MREYIQWALPINGVFLAIFACGAGGYTIVHSNHHQLGFLAIVFAVKMLFLSLANIHFLNQERRLINGRQ